MVLIASKPVFPKVVSFVLKPGETLEFYAVFSGRKLVDASSGRNDAGLSHINILSERAAREALISQWWSNLVLDTPDPVLNRMFAFAKLRGAEKASTARKVDWCMVPVVKPIMRLSGLTTRQSISTPSSLFWVMRLVMSPH